VRGRASREEEGHHAGGMSQACLTALPPRPHTFLPDLCSFSPLPRSGRSSSTLQLNAEKGYATYTGSLVVEDGGFCGTRASGAGVSVDLSGFDGVRLRVRGDGRRYKLNVKTTDTLASENVYQAAFDTMDLEEGEGWQTITLPFHRFFPVVRNRVDYRGAPLQSSSQVAVSFGLVYSRFEFNRQANPYYAPGAFALAMQELSLYRSQRPAIVLVSSAGAERNAKVETEEDRKKVGRRVLRAFFPTLPPSSPPFNRPKCLSCIF